MVATTQPRHSSLPLIFLMLLALAMGALLLYGVDGVTDTVRARPEHSVAKHGDVVQRIHQCLNDKGPSQIWKSKSWRTPNRYFFGCELDDGTWGLSIVDKTKNGWLEKTTFRIKDGTLKQFVEYVSARAELVQGVLP